MHPADKIELLIVLLPRNESEFDFDDEYQAILQRSERKAEYIIDHLKTMASKVSLSEFVYHVSVLLMDRAEAILANTEICAQ
jgi:hypothetical protein